MGDSGSMCPVFRPTREEFEQPFCEYVRKVFRKHPDLPMFKVVPPRGWKPRRNPFPDLRKVQINVPIRQHVFGTKGAYRCVFVEQKPMSVAEFKLAAEEEVQKLRGAQARDGDSAGAGGVRASTRTTSSRHNRPPVNHEATPTAQRGAAEGDTADGSSGGQQPPSFDPDAVDTDMERSFWANVTLNPPMYGADTPTSFFDEKLPYGWNLQHLGDLLQNHPKVDSVPGVTTPMTYFGMWRSFFGWHKEDADLYSVNFLHWGAPKIWYGVAPSARHKFERMAQSLFPELHRACPAFVRHKDIMLSPACLKTYGVPLMRACQRPNEFVVLNAAAYHAGFNSGFNCAEAVNFGMKEWIPVGKEAVPCRCTALKDGVRISMKLFDPKWVDPYETPSESSSANDSDASSSSEEEEEEEAPAKRRRGRAQPTPPTKRGQKKKQEDSSEEEVEEEVEEEEEEEEEPAEDATPKRKRTITKKAAAAAADAAAKARKRARSKVTASKAVAAGVRKKTAAAAVVKKAAARGRTAVTVKKPAARATKATAVNAVVAKKVAATTKAAASKKTPSGPSKAAASEPAAAAGRSGRKRKAVEEPVEAEEPKDVEKSGQDIGKAEEQPEELGRGGRRRRATVLAAEARAAAAAAAASPRKRTRAGAGIVTANIAAKADGERDENGNGAVADGHSGRQLRGRVVPEIGSGVTDEHDGCGCTVGEDGGVGKPTTAVAASAPAAGGRSLRRAGSHGLTAVAVAPMEPLADTSAAVGPEVNSNGRPVVTAVKPRSTVAAAAMALKARSQTRSQEVVVGPPMAIIGDAEVTSGRRSAAAAAADKRFFFLVQRLARPAPTPGNVLLRWLKEGRDGLFRPVAGSVWEEPAGALLPVSALAIGAEGPSAPVGDIMSAADMGSGSAASSSTSVAGMCASPSSEPEAWRLITPREQIVAVELRRD